MFRLNASRIRQLMFERELNISALAKAAKLNGFTARKIVTDGARVNGATVGRLAKFFGVNGEDLLEKRKEDNNDISARRGA